MTFDNDGGGHDILYIAWMHISGLKIDVSYPPRSGEPDAGSNVWLPEATVTLSLLIEELPIFRFFNKINLNLTSVETV